MDNTSKALAIAGGILLGILILSILIYAFAHVQSYERSKVEVLKAEELAKFNMEFEKYNKETMYGTDIISVVNKAIEYNKKYGDIITVEVTTTEDFYKTITCWIAADGRKDDSRSSVELILGHGTYNNNSNEFVNTFLNSTDKKEIKNEYDGDRKTAIIEIKPAVSEFKNKKFRCTSVEYDSSSGRIKKMYFAQK